MRVANRHRPLASRTGLETRCSGHKPAPGRKKRGNPSNSVTINTINTKYIYNYNKN